MIPANTNVGQTIVISDYATKTYKLDFENKRIVGFVDDLAAVKQFIYKTLQTERYAYIIYSDIVGIELENLSGKDPDFVKGVLQSRIEDALLVDNRISSITDFTYETIQGDQEKEALVVTFVANTIYGDTTITDLEI